MGFIQFYSFVITFRLILGHLVWNRQMAEERRAKKIGRLSKKEYLAKVTLPPGVLRQRQRAYLNAWNKKRAEAERSRSNFVKYPIEYKRFIAKKRSNYFDWWKHTLHRQENPLPVHIKKRKPKTLAMRIRRRLKRLVKTKIGKRTSYLIGCNTQFLKSYLESQFTHRMSWSNYGTYWHIDHIIPLSKFDLTNEFQLLQACHYSNLQPLLALHNLNKAAKITHPQLNLPIQLPDSINAYPSKISKRSKKISAVGTWI